MDGGQGNEVVSVTGNMTLSPGIALTPALSHPMGEGESSDAGWKNRELEIARCASGKPGDPDGCSLSHRMGEGKGEGLSV
jgi:hypothetical protein